MKSRKTSSLLLCFVVGLLFKVGPTKLQAATTFVTIGSGDFTGVYFPAGLTIAEMVNNKRNQYGIRATVESTPGSVFNVNAVMAGYLEFGLVQSDKQYQAVKGLSEWRQKGPHCFEKSAVRMLNRYIFTPCAIGNINRSQMLSVRQAQPPGEWVGMV